MILLYVKYHMTCHLTINNIFVTDNNGQWSSQKTEDSSDHAGSWR
jgi:hypothetical protein